MNLVVSLLITAKEERVIEALATLLPAKGRPLFSDELNPDWQDVYKPIELLSPPDEVMRLGSYIFAEWYETEYPANTLARVCKDAGAEVLFIHSVDDSSVIGDFAEEEDEQGYYSIKINGEMKTLTSSNFAELLPNSGLKWKADVESNVQQIINYLVS